MCAQGFCHVASWGHFHRKKKHSTYPALPIHGLLQIARGCQRPILPNPSTGVFYGKKETCHWDTMPYSYMRNDKGSFICRRTDTGGLRKNVCNQIQYALWMGILMFVSSQFKPLEADPSLRPLVTMKRTLRIKEHLKCVCCEAPWSN